MGDRCFSVFVLSFFFVSLFLARCEVKRGLVCKTIEQFDAFLQHIFLEAHGPSRHLTKHTKHPIAQLAAMKSPRMHG